MTKEHSLLGQANDNLLFLEARTHNQWHAKDVSDELLVKIYSLAKWGPTSTNCAPMRIVFVKSASAKEKLRPCLMEANVEKTMTAPVTAVIGHDIEFYKKLDYLSPANNARTWFEGPNKENLIQDTAYRNSTLQGAYFMLAARAYGLDCGPMSGFDNVAAKKAFFPDKAVEVNFLCNLGYGDPAGLYPRGPKLTFEEVAVII